MARITVQDCLSNEGNRFRLVRLASKRAKQLLDGNEAVVERGGNRSVVSALREIAEGNVKAHAPEPALGSRDSLDADKFFSALEEHLPNH